MMSVNGTVYHQLPDAMGCPNVSTDHRPRLLTPVVGPLKRSFSGISWYLARAAMAEKVLDGAFALTTDTTFNMRLRTRGALWKLLRLLQGRNTRGYKYDPTFSDTVWSQYLNLLADTMIINNCQYFGRYFNRHYRQLNVTPCFYIDGTLTEYLFAYGAVGDDVVAAIGADVVRRAIDMEREGYAYAERIIAMSRATVRNLVEAYGIPSDRIALVMPGANIDDADVVAPSPHTGWFGDEFTLGFVGLYWRRKGLDKLADAVQILRSRGAPIRLRVIGRCPDAIAAMEGVDFLGIINKESDTARFVETIRSVDLGCQLSGAELTGIAMMEFLRVGVPIIATNLGGIPDMFEDGGGLLVSPDISTEQLVEELHILMTDTDRYQALRHAAMRRAEWASWRRVAQEMNAALVGL
jgi:glycosyltransferase involved in cell wall biosynthesis